MSNMRSSVQPGACGKVLQFPEDEIEASGQAGDEKVREAEGGFKSAP
jgi:hypothetical protein